MRHRLLLIVLLIVAPVSLAYVAYKAWHPGSAAAATCLDQDQLQPLPSQHAQPAAGEVPIIFVHGITSSYQTWTHPELNGGEPLSQRVAAIPGASVWGFDYSKESLDWVTNPAIGPTLAGAITCLTQITGKSAILIAHSMGGLATQYAAAQRDGNGTVGDHIAEVITLGTPYKGSKVLSAAQIAVKGGEDLADPEVAAAVEALLSACAGLSETGLASGDSNPCSLLAVLRSPIGTALEYDSPQIAALPAWSPSIPVNDIDGNIDLTLSILFWHHTFDVGDIAVSNDSAVAHNTAGSPFNITCSMNGFKNLTSGEFLDCYHGNLPKNPTIVNYVLSHVSRLVSAEHPLSTTTTPPSASTPPPLTTSSHCADWYAASSSQQRALAVTVSPGVQLTTTVPSSASGHAAFMEGFIEGGCDRAKSRGLSPSSVPLSDVLAGNYSSSSSTSTTPPTTTSSTTPPHTAGVPTCIQWLQMSLSQRYAAVASMQAAHHDTSSEGIAYYSVRAFCAIYPNYSIDGVYNGNL